MYIYIHSCVCVCVCVYLFILKLMENRRGFHETTGENPPASRSRWKQFQMIIAARIRGGEGKGWGKSKLEDVERTERSKEEEEGGEGEGGGEREGGGEGGGGGGKVGEEGGEGEGGEGGEGEEGGGEGERNLEIAFRILKGMPRSVGSSGGSTRVAGG